MSQDWFSTKLRFICLIEAVGAHQYMDSMFIFQSTDFDAAFNKALTIGVSRERNYLNADGRQVVWKLKEVISLDLIGPEIMDGTEVYSEPVEIEDNRNFPFGIKFHPEKSQPTQTI